MNTTETLIREYYACFNERRLRDASELFADEAVLEHVPIHRPKHARTSYLQFANAWITAFPDALLNIERIVARTPSTHEVSLVATGTHHGPLDLGGWLFKPTGIRATLYLRELLDARNGRFVFSSVSVDVHQMVEQLVLIDHAELLEHVNRIRALGDELASRKGDPTLMRDTTKRLGQELDAARHVIRPYFKR